MGLCVCKGVSPSRDGVPKWGMTEVSTTVVGAGVGSASKEGVRDGKGEWRQVDGLTETKSSMWLFSHLTQAAA